MPIWPLLSRLYGLHPWDTAKMTETEIDAYVRDLNRILSK